MTYPWESITSSPTSMPAIHRIIDEKIPPRIEWSHLKLRMNEECWRPWEFRQALALFTYDSNEGQNLVEQKAVVCHWVSVFDKGLFNKCKG